MNNLKKLISLEDTINKQYDSHIAKTYSIIIGTAKKRKVNARELNIHRKDVDGQT